MVLSSWFLDGRRWFSVLDLDVPCIEEYAYGMSTTADKVVADALSLPAPARAFVAEKLIESLDAEPGDELSPAWKEEVRRRCRELDDGAVELRSAEDVFAKAYAALK
jgi:putative addiction module component (TIGR02574 family)